jgi:LysM repeat protein
VKKSRLFSLILSLVLLWLLVNVATANTTHVVQPGDTLSGIARRYGTTVQALAETNHIVNPNLIFAGQTLVIPTSGGSPPPPPPPPATGGSTTYVVQPGDTLSRIALRFGVTLQALAQTNNIGNVNLIFTGQVLAIPGATVPAPPPPAPGPTATPQPPPPTPGPVAGANLLPNPSFEEGWYNRDGVAELQLPNQWTFEWDEGANPFDAAPWSAFVRPETRVLPGAFLPAHERDLYIWDGNHTVKIFKGMGAISFRLLAGVQLPPGTYTLSINIFPDLIHAYTSDGRKVWAPDPQSGEVRLVAGSGGSGWLLPTFGQRNTFSHTFTVTEPQTMRVGAAVRGRYAILNNGWFMDDWSLRRVQ